MKLVNKLSRHLMFAAVLSGLVIYISCKEIVGQLPPFEYVIDEEIAFDAGVDTTLIRAEDITVTPSSITNQAAEEMSSTLSLANTPEAQAALQEISTEVDKAVNSTQQAYFQNKTSDQIIAGVEGKNTTMVNNINAVKNAIAANATLQEYLPEIDQPSGRVSNAGRVGGEIVFVESPSEVNGIDAEVTSCLEAYTEWAIAEKARLKGLYDTSNGLITTAYNRAKQTLDNRKSAMQVDFLNTYNTRIAHFVSLWSTTASNVNAALNAGRISAAVASDILLWNNIVFAINVYFTYELYQAELTLVNSNYSSALTKLNTARDGVKAGLDARYEAALKEVSDFVKEMTADCHDQGSHDQGGN